jgi:excisionase family DNA binding protein
MNTKTTKAPDQLMTVREVAALFRVRPATIYLAVSEGRLRAIKLLKTKKSKRSSIRFRRSEIDALLGGAP